MTLGNPVRTGFKTPRRGPGAAFALIFAVAAVMLAAAGCSGREPTLEERAVALDRQLMCPVCEGQTLDESRSELAQQMKRLIREKLTAGESEEQIKAYFADPARYGLVVLAAPPASGFGIALWVLPPVAAVVAAGTLFLIMWDRKRRAAPEAAVTADEGHLAPYLDRVDEDLGLRPTPPVATVTRASPASTQGEGNSHKEA
jgi:cytochrome c-type biogenesis protein CcmH